MDPVPRLLHEQQKVDADHLKLLAVFHFVVAGLALMGIGFLLVHYLFMRSFMFNPKMWQGQAGGPPPQEFLAILQWVYVLMGVLLILGSVGNLISGLCLRARRYREFSLVIAAVNCLQIPLGTVLGVFTIIVLMRDSVRDAYEAREVH